MGTPIWGLSRQVQNHLPVPQLAHLLPVAVLVVGGVSRAVLQVVLPAVLPSSVGNVVIAVTLPRTVLILGSVQIARQLDTKPEPAQEMLKMPG